MSARGPDEASCVRCGRRGVRVADDATFVVAPDGAEPPLVSESRHGRGPTCDPCEAAMTEEAEARAGFPALMRGRAGRRRRGRRRVGRVW